MAQAEVFNPFAIVFDLFQTAMKFNETLLATPAVIAARMPVIGAVFHSPFSADYRELALMVSEKADAFSRSASLGSQGGKSLQASFNANSADIRKLWSGSLVSPFDFWRIAERNLAMMTTFFALPGTVLAPIHKGVTNNARRLKV